MTPAATRHLTIAFALLGLAGTSPAWATTSITRSSSFAYDSASGLLTQEVVEPNTQSLRLETDYTYDAFGNKLSAAVSGVDIATRSSSTTYDSKGQFAVSASNALSQSESWAYDARFGVATSHTGPNGLTTTWSYDSVGRKTLETRADGTQTKYAYLFCSGFNSGTASCPSGAVYLVQATPFASGGTTQNGPQSTGYFDQLGRAIASDTQGFDGSLIRTTTQYDSLMRVLQASRPFFVSGGTPVYTVPSYDALNRVIKTTFPDGSTAQIAYHGLSVTTTSALGQASTAVKNDQGLVASVTDALGKVTSYQYDPLGNLIQTTDPAGNVMTGSYDTRGRKVTMSDPDMGAWSYAYDTLSELTSQTDAKSQTTTLQYDLLGRLTQRVEPDMTCTWAYDSATMGIGKLASAAVTSGLSYGFQRSYTYDSLGRPSQVAVTVDGTTYTMATTYDSNGRVSTSTYASGLVVQYGYTSLGYQNQLLNNATGQVYWTANTFDASLHLLQQTAGNGVVTNQTFDPNTGRLTAIQAGSSGAVENLAYVYDKLGNVSSRADNGAVLSETFQYDALNRLTSSTITGSTANPPAKSFAYDALGNITTKSDVGNYTYPAAGAPQPHAVTSISGGTISATFTYDPNGNQTAGLGREITYAADNMPEFIFQGTIDVSFTYDTDHQRLTKTDTSNGTVTTTLYLGAAEMVTSASGSVTWNEYISAGGGLVAVRFNAVTAGTVTTRYLHKDGLGSVAVLTDENANVVQRISYDPWGKQRSPSTWSDDPTGSLPPQDQTTRGFTGQEQLEDVGLVDMNARVYDPQIGRFLSADSVVQDPYDARSFNRYSYVYDNPLAYTDPSGHCFLGLCHLTSVFKTLARPIVGPLGFIPAIGHGFDDFMRDNPILQQIGLIAASSSCPGYTAAACAFGAAAYNAGINGGSFNQMLRAGAIAGAEAAAAHGIGQLAGGVSAGVTNATGSTIAGSAAYAAVSIAARVAVGCAGAAASGGSCGTGAAAAAAGTVLGTSDTGNLVIDVTLNAVAGGLTSLAGGGKFENGALTGAFGYLFSPAGFQAARAAVESLFPPPPANSSPVGTFDIAGGTGGLRVSMCDVGCIGLGESREKTLLLGLVVLIPGVAEMGAVSEGVVVTEQGLAIIEQHLAQFGEWEYNDAMIERLAAQLGSRVTGYDANFYTHEMIEAEYMAAGLDAESAHAAALAETGVSPFEIYHPEVVRRFQDAFSTAWKAHLGIVP
jgi:RHS repeat-associated protein